MSDSFSSRKIFAMATSFALAVIVLAVSLSGCAGGFLSRINHSSELPKELPKDYYKKFEIKDGADSSASSAFVGPELPPAEAAKIAQEQRQQRSHRGKEWMRSQEQQVRDLELAQIGPKQHLPLVYRKIVSPSGKSPIWIGEKLSYEVSYLGLTAGTFVLEALPYKSIGGRKVYDIQATVHSSNAFSIFYRLQDVVETFIDADAVFSHRFHMQLDETKQVRDSLELFDSENEQAFWWNRWDRREKGYEEKKEFHPMEPFPQDSLSSLYYLRFMPLPLGAEVKFVVESEAKPLDMVMTVVDREKLDTPAGEFRTVKIKPQAATRGVLERKGDSFLWLTDDDRRFLVRFEAKVKIGTIVIKLMKVEQGRPPAAHPELEAAPKPIEGHAR